MKDISLRPKKQLMKLFEAVQNLDNLPSTNRNSIIDRALDVALTNGNVNWQSVSEVSIENDFNDKIPNHIVLKVNEEKFLQVKAQIKETFNEGRITIPYTLTLLLTLYFIYLKQHCDTINQDSDLSEILKIDFKINTWVLKNEYEQSLYAKKKHLLEMCKVLLRNNPIITEQLVTQSSRDLNECIGFINLDKYFSDKMNESNPTTTHIAKVLAGLFIVRVESKNILDLIIKQLETEFQIIGAAVDNADSTDYFKNVYAKMMGGKV